MDNKKKSECIIHIGMRKTGLSTIQETLFNMGVVSNNIDYLRFRKKRLIELERAIHNNIADKVVISGEGIPSLSTEALHELQIFLLKFFDKISIICYVRDWKAFMTSLFQQRLKGGKDNLETIDLLPRYKESFEKFDVVFGKSNVHFIKFDRETLKNGDVAFDFCYRVQFPIEKIENKILHTNESLSLEAVKILYIYNKFTKKHEINRPGLGSLVSLVKNFGSTKFQFCDSFFLHLATKVKDDMKWMEMRMDVCFSETSKSSYSRTTCVATEEDLVSLNNSFVQNINNYFSFTSWSSSKELTNKLHALR